MNTSFKNILALFIVALSVQAHLFLNIQSQATATNIEQQAIVLQHPNNNTTQVVIIESPKRKAKEQKDYSRFSDINLLQILVQKVKEGVPSFGY